MSVLDGATPNETSIDAPIEGAIPDSQGIPGNDTPIPADSGAPAGNTVAAQPAAAAAVQQAAAQAGINLTPEQLEQILERAVSRATAPLAQQLAPKPPTAPKIYEQQDWLTRDSKHFSSGVEQLIDDRFEAKYGNDIRQLMGQVQQLSQTMPALYAYSQPNPQWGATQSRANELVNKYGVTPQVALRMAADEINKQPGKVPAVQRPTVPAHASSPDNRGNALPPDEDAGKPADFAAIMRDLRKSGQFK